MNIFSERLKNALNEKNMKAIELSQKTGISKSSISDWINGRYEAKQDKIFLIAEALDINESYLLGLNVPMNKNKNISNSSLLSKINKISSQLEEPRQQTVLDTATTQLNEQNKSDVVSIEKYKNGEEDEDESYIDDIATGLVSAGSGVWQDDYIQIDVRFPESEAPERYDSIAKVIGQSMEPVIRDADLLFIEATSQIDFNEIGIFQVNGENYVKKLRVDNYGVPYLESINNDYDDIDLSEDDEIRIIGRVVGIYRI